VALERFGEGAGGAPGGSTYMGAIAKEMRVGEHNKSVGRSLFETNEEREGLLGVGGVVQHAWQADRGCKE